MVSPTWNCGCGVLTPSFMYYRGNAMVWCLPYGIVGFWRLLLSHCSVLTSDTSSSHPASECDKERSSAVNRKSSVGKQLEGEQSFFCRFCERVSTNEKWAIMDQHHCDEIYMTSCWLSWWWWWCWWWFRWKVQVSSRCGKHSPQIQPAKQDGACSSKSYSIKISPHIPYIYITSLQVV